MDNSRKVYLNVIVRCNNTEIPVRALIDTGNTVKARSVMDKKLHEKLGHRGSPDPNSQKGVRAE